MSINDLSFGSADVSHEGRQQKYSTWNLEKQQGAELC